MKVKLIAIIVFLFTIKTTFSQILIGPVVGPQMSWVSFFDKDAARHYKQKPSIGFHAGANLSFRVQKRFFLHTSLLYSMKGKILEEKNTDVFQNKARYHFIEMPIAYTAEFLTKVGKEKQFKWYLGIGPNISYWLAGKGRLQTPGLNEIIIDHINYKMVFNKDIGQAGDTQMRVTDPNRLQLGLNISAGLAFEPVGFNKVMVSMRYELGHSFFNREGKGEITIVPDYADDLKVRNQGLRLSVAYLIDLKNDEKKKGKSTIKKKNMK